MKPLALDAVLFGLTRQAVTAQVEGHYRAVGYEGVTVPAGTFEALKVRGIETVYFYRKEQRISYVVRLEQWYVRGLGKVKEIWEFPDQPQLGQLVAELTAFQGLQPEQVITLSSEGDRKEK